MVNTNDQSHLVYMMTSNRTFTKFIDRKVLGFVLIMYYDTCDCNCLSGTN